MSDIRQRLINMTRGIHLGDAIGVPFELMMRQEILAANGGKPITGPAFHLAFEREIDDTRGLPPGSTSDDSQLSNAVSEGLILGDGYVHELQVLLHLKALWHDVSGWGGTTKLGLYEIDQWYRARRKRLAHLAPPTFKKAKDQALWQQARPRNPFHPAMWREKARGNGPSMKIAPFGAFLAARGGDDPFASGAALDQILQFSRMTHGDPLCAVAAYAVAGVVHDLIRGFSPEATFTHLTARAQAADAHMHLIHQGPDRFSSALRYALSLSSKPEELWAFGSKEVSDSLNSVPLALVIWYRHCQDGEPTAAVLEAINAGGDTDTVASMVGAMMGAGSGERNWWPDAWLAQLHDGGALALKLGQDLYRAAVRASAHHPEWDRQALLGELGYL